MKNAACFDIGGTFIKYGIVDEEGNILFKSKFETPKRNCKVNIPSVISEYVKELSKGFQINCIGISTAGQVDSDKGEIVFASDNLPEYTGAKLSKDVKELTGYKCTIENDVNAAALGELWKGSLEGSNTFLFLALGTGIGGAIIIDGKLYKGVHGGAGEAGHMVLNENGEDCNCGGKGCYERYASTSALVRIYSKMANVPSESVNGEIIMDKVEKGDGIAVKAYNEFTNHIASGLLGLSYLLDPGFIVIGGGISENKKFIEDINNKFKQKAMVSYAENTKIIQSTLKNDAGLIGAAYVAFNY